MTSDQINLDARMKRLEGRCLVIGALLLVATLGGGLRHPEMAYPGYLCAYIFWLGLTLGGMAILMVHYLVGGAWGLISRRVLEATACTMPLMILLFAPILLGLRTLYPWARPGEYYGLPRVRHLQAYLNPEFFSGRAAFYFMCWSVCAYLLVRWSTLADRHPSPALLRFRERLSGGGLVLYAVTLYFASIDWVMSTELTWSSTIYGLIFMASQGLSAFALCICVLTALAKERDLRGVVTPARLNDLGNLLLTAVMLWAYVSFSQYLIMWSENLPRETSWYIHRTGPGWNGVAILLLLMHFAVPFFVLLFRKIKQSPPLIAAVAWGLLALRWLDDFWRIIPAFEPSRLAIHWTYLTAALGVGGLWVGLFLDRLRRQPLLPVHDPQFESLLSEARSHG